MKRGPMARVTVEAVERGDYDSPFTVGQEQRRPDLCQCRHLLAQHAEKGQRRCLVESDRPCGCGTFWALWPDDASARDEAPPN